jgi:hypothetical protein
MHLAGFTRLISHWQTETGYRNYTCTTCYATSQLEVAIEWATDSVEER